MSKRRPPLPESCPCMRTVLVRKSKLNLATGAMSEPDAGTWRTEPCNIPLFGAQREFGRCRACYADEAWTMEGNRPATLREVAAYKAGAGERPVHAIRAWDAGAGEDTLCGIMHGGPQLVERSNLHVYVSCPTCREHPDFRASRTEPPWPLPVTIAESTADLQRMSAMGAP